MEKEPQVLDHNNFIPYAKQNISEKDSAHVCRVLRSDFITQGHMVPKFEAAVSEKVGANNSLSKPT